MSAFCRWIRDLFMPNDNNDDHPHAIELGRVVGAVQDDQQARVHPPDIGNDHGAGQGMAAAIGLDGDSSNVGDIGQHAVEMQHAEEGSIQDINSIGDAGDSIGDAGDSSGGEAGQHAAELQDAEEGDIRDENGGGDAGQHAAELQAAEEGNIQNGGGDDENAGQAVADPQHGGDAADGIGNGDDARRRRRRRLLKLLLSLVLEVLRLTALSYVKTVFLEDSLSLFDVLQRRVGIVLIVVSIAIECLRGRGVVDDTEADLLCVRSRRVMRLAQALLSLLTLFC